MSLFGGGASSATTPAASSAQGDLKQDIQIQNGPEDSISSLAWSPTHDYLAVGSWDKKCRIYEVDGQGNSKGIAMIEHEAPVLDVAWSKVCYDMLVKGNEADIALYRMVDMCFQQVQTKW
jgi:mRNA export factor